MLISTLKHGARGHHDIHGHDDCVCLDALLLDVCGVLCLREAGILENTSGTGWFVVCVS